MRLLAGFRETFEGAVESGALFNDGIQKAMALGGRQVVIVAKYFGRGPDRGDAGPPVVLHFDVCRDAPSGGAVLL